VVKNSSLSQFVCMLVTSPRWLIWLRFSLPRSTSDRSLILCLVPIVRLLVYVVDFFAALGFVLSGRFSFLRSSMPSRSACRFSPVTIFSVRPTLLPVSIRLHVLRQNEPPNFVHRGISARPVSHSPCCLISVFSLSLLHWPQSLSSRTNSRTRHTLARVLFPARD
jgi:hypothetical protein